MTTFPVLTSADRDVCLALSFGDGECRRKLHSRPAGVPTRDARRAIVVFVPGRKMIWCIASYAHADVGVPEMKP